MTKLICLYNYRKKKECSIEMLIHVYYITPTQCDVPDDLNLDTQLPNLKLSPLQQFEGYRIKLIDRKIKFHHVCTPFNVMYYHSPFHYSSSTLHPTTNPSLSRGCISELRGRKGTKLGEWKGMKFNDKGNLVLRLKE